MAKNGRSIGYSSVMAAVTVLATGTVFYRFVEQFTWLDAFYFSVSTFATVGYGDFVPSTVAGKLFTSFYMLTGVAILTGYFTMRLRRDEEAREKPEESKRTSKTPNE